MTKPISKSKRQLAQLLIEAGVTQFPEGANWAAQDRDGSKYPSEPLTVMFYNVNPTRPRKGAGYWFGEGVATDIVGKGVQLSILTPNWHQTVLSRDEFDQIVAETVVESEPELVELTSEDLSRMRSTAVGDDETNLAVKGEQAEPQYCEPVVAQAALGYSDEVVNAMREHKPTLDQLLHDWRSADDYAQRRQAEADEAAAMRDERWQAVQARAGEMGVTVGRCESVVDGPVKPVTTGKFRNAKLGSPESYHRELKDEICDECGLRFGLHYNLRCKP